MQEVALGRVLGAGDRCLVRQRGLRIAAQASKKVRADGVEQVVCAEVEAVDEGERCIRSLDLGHRHRAVEGHDRAQGERQQLVVQLQDLPPVGGGGGRRVAVDGVDRRLDLIRAGLVATEALPDDGLAFGDQASIPEAAVLVGQQHEVAVRGRARGPARLDEQHEREQP